MKAVLKNYRQAPRKVRLVADAIRGKRVSDAITNLSHLSKNAALPMKKLLTSAVSNAKETGVLEQNLFIKKITVDKGITFRRFMPRARGRAAPIKKETSHIMVELVEKKSEAQNSKE